jgi:hypothetical protein
MLILIFSLLSGCCRQPRPTTVADATEDLVETLRARNLTQPTLRGELRVDHFGPEGRVAGKVYAFAASGGRLRLEAVSPMDTPLRTVAVDGVSFSMVDQESQRCLEGPADPCLIGQAVGIELSASHVAAALAGGVPILRHQRATSDWNRCGRYELQLEGDDGWTEVIQLILEQGQLVPIRATVRDREGVVLDMELSDHQPAGALLLPRRMILRTPRSEADLRVEWRQIEVGVTLPDRAWAATCPSGFTIETASCTPSTSLTVLEEPSALPEPPPDEPGDDSDQDQPPSDDIDLSEELGL